MDKARLDQIVGECLVKAANIVLGSRITAATQPSTREQHKAWVMPCYCYLPPSLCAGRTLLCSRLDKALTQ